MVSYDYFDDNLKGLYCDERAYIICAQYYQIKNYPLALGNTWNLKWIPEKKLTCGEKINDGRDSKAICKELSRICGISMVYNNSIDAITAYNNIIPRLLDCNAPIGLYFDLYWCKWTRHYLKNHSYHIIIIIAKQIDGYLCVDTNFSQKIELLNKNDFILGYRAIYEIVLEPQNITRHDIGKYISNMTFINLEGIKDNLRLFCINIKKEISWEKEFYYNDAFDVPMIYNLYLLIGGRLMFKKFLEYISDFSKASSYNNILNVFNEIIFHWTVLFNIIKKSYIMKIAPPQYKLDDVVNNIFTMENKALLKLNEIIKIKDGWKD